MKNIKFLFQLAIWFWAAISGFSVTSHAAEPDTKLVGQINSYLENHLPDQYSGAILIAKEGKILHAKGYGFANKSRETPNGVQTVFNIGTLTEQFTAVAILKLVQQGKLKLDDPLPTFFEKVPTNKQNVTLHHLLTHSSGVLKGQKTEFFDVVTKSKFLNDVLNRKPQPKSNKWWTDDRRLAYEPGRRFDYYPEGYGLLALIVEKVSGQNYESFLDEHLFTPAGMAHTGYKLPRWRQDQLAVSYQSQTKKTQGTFTRHWQTAGGVSWYLKGGLGLHSTVEDLYKWQQALHAGKILSKPLLQQLQTPHIAVPNSTVYFGYGLFVGRTPIDSKVVGNAGGLANSIKMPGFFTRYRFYPEDDIVIILLANEYTDEVSGIGSEVSRLMLEPDYQFEASKCNATLSVK